MSTEFSFSLALGIDSQSGGPTQMVPLLSELVVGSSDASDGVSNGFLFRLNLAPDDAPVQINLGDLIGFIEGKLGAGVNTLQNAPGLSDIAPAFSNFFSQSTFDSGNTVVVLIKAFEINSSTTQKLFNISVEIESADPTEGIIPMPAPLMTYLSIENLAVAFECQTGAAADTNLQIGLNALVGGIPVSLGATIDKAAAGSTYTFDGSVQDATIPLSQFLGVVASQFNIDVQLPPELNLSPVINYLAGQVVHTVPASGTASTEFGASAQFALSVEGNEYTLTCFAGTAPAAPDATTTLYTLGATIAQVNGALAFSSLPLVGDIPGFNQLALTQFGFTYSSVPAGTTPVAFQIPQVTATPNPLYTRSDKTAPEANTYAITSGTTMGAPGSGFSIMAGLLGPSGEVLGNFALPLSLPASTPPANPALPAPYSTAASSTPASPVHWITVGKTFGPVTLQQIGLNYDSTGRATFGLSAAFALGGFSLDLEGLTVEFPLPLLGSSGSDLSVSFGLQGLSMGFSSGPLSVNGAFLHATGATPGYFGEVSVQAANFGLKAMGGYIPGPPASFFLYAMVDIPLGGPPFLFVTGFAGGFGVNTALVLPTLATLSGYFLLPQNATPPGDTPSATMNTLLPQLQSNFPQEAGEYWVAAGIQFTSFEMVQAFAVLTVAFGVDLQIALIGSCAISLPTGEPAAYIEIDFMASFSASSGLFAIQGKLSPASYLFGGFCKLTGGFAFFVWTSGANQGQFVVTVGGYNPGFTPPSYYPAVPRLGIAFGLGPFQVTGTAYFALTPAMMMGGIAMSATWSSGGISAWFNAGADFLIAWAPLYYQADAYVTLGCSIDIGLYTLKVQVGADLQLWGPPFGGQAEVHLDVASFTVSFGSSGPAAAPPLGWTGFKSAFLPASTSAQQSKRSERSKRSRRSKREVTARDTDADNSNVLTASAPSGLISSDYQGTDGTTYDWILNPDTFSILTSSTVPANHGEWTINLSNGTVYELPNLISSYGVTPPMGDPYLALPAGGLTYASTNDPNNPNAVWCPNLNIAPMHLTNVDSYHTVTLTDVTTGVQVTSLSVQPVLMDSSAALWAQDNSTSKTPNDPAMVSFALVGFLITPIPQTPDTLSAVPLVDLVFETDPPVTGFTYGSAQISTAYQVAGTVTGSGNISNLSIVISGGESEILDNSDYVLASLADPWVTAQRTAILDDFQNNGFATMAPSAVNLALTSSTTRLRDWPAVGLLGSM